MNHTIKPTEPTEDGLRKSVTRIMSDFGLAAAFYGINKERNPVPKDPTDELLQLFLAHSLQERIDELKFLDTCPPALIYVGIADRIKQLEAAKEAL